MKKNFAVTITVCGMLCAVFVLFQNFNTVEVPPHQAAQSCIQHPQTCSNKLIISAKGCAANPHGCTDVKNAKNCLADAVACANAHLDAAKECAHDASACEESGFTPTFR